MEDWFEKYKKSEEEISSLASDAEKKPKNDTLNQQEPSAQKNNEQSKRGEVQQEPKEAITQLGSSYEIKEVTKAQNQKSNFPLALLIIVVVAPLLFVLIMGIVSNRQKAPKPKNENFLYSTIESKYFTLSVDPNYSVDSVVDKKVPFLERHILTNNKDGLKTLTILIKDVKFDYDVESNLGVRARRENPQLYNGQPFELSSKKGLYFKKTSENFEHYVVLVDRSRSIIYEITMESPTTFSNDMNLESEFRGILDGITFLEQQ